jgi:hypothetical protein
MERLSVCLSGCPTEDEDDSIQPSLSKIVTALPNGVMLRVGQAGSSLRGGSWQVGLAPGKECAAKV